jgi:hypothetical protein
MMIRNILIITIIAALVPTAMSSVSASAASEIALFSSDSDSLSISGNGDNAKMELKATNENGRTKRVSDFQLTADNVLYIKVGDKVAVKDKVDFTNAITTDARNNQKAIGITSNGVIDFGGYAQDVYTLDVVVDDDRAYEAIIVIGQQTKEVVDKEITRVNNKYVTDISFKTVIKFPDNNYDDKCSSKQGSAALSYPYQHISQCQKEEFDQCEEDEAKGLKETDACDAADERFFDDCEGFANQKECDEYWNIPPIDDPCGGQWHIPEDRDCDGEIDPGFGPNGPGPKPEPPTDDPCAVGEARIPEDKNCDGEIDDEFKLTQAEEEPESEPQPEEEYIVDEGDLDEPEEEEEQDESTDGEEEEPEEKSTEGEESDDSGETSE